MQTKLTTEQSLVTKLICAGCFFLGFGLSQTIEREIFDYSNQDDARHFSTAFGLLALASAWLVKRILAVQAEKDATNPSKAGQEK